MKKYVLAGIALVVAILAYQAWPLIGAWQLASAAKGGEAEEVLQRVDLPALRTQITRQIVRAYLEQTGKAPKGALERGVAINVGTSIAEPYVAEILNPENLTSLLRSGRIPGAAAQPSLLSGEKLPNFSGLLNANAWTIFVNSHFDGWMGYLIEVPGEAGADAFGVHLHLAGLTWRLSGIDLPKSIVGRVVQEIVQRQKQKEAQSPS